MAIMPQKQLFFRKEIEARVDQLRERLPDFGKVLAADGKAIQAHAQPPPRQVTPRHSASGAGGEYIVLSRARGYALVRQNWNAA